MALLLQQLDHLDGEEVMEVVGQEEGEVMEEDTEEAMVVEVLAVNNEVN